jgi:hypothetical protein
MGSEAEYVDPEYMPEGFTFKEPSKLSKVEAYARLKFWYDRQQDPKIKRVFQFSRIKGKNGEPELPDRGRKAKKSNKTGGRKAPRSGMGRPGHSDSSDSNEDEGEEDEDEDEEEEEEPLERDEETGGNSDEDHPPLKKRSLPVPRGSKHPKPLPFAAVRVRPQGARARTGAVAGHRSRPAAAGPGGPKTGAGDKEGPGTERPQTRQQKRRALDEEEIGQRKRSKHVEEVTRIGPPRGQKKDKPAEGQGKRKAKN